MSERRGTREGPNIRNIAITGKRVEERKGGKRNKR